MTAPAWTAVNLANVRTSFLQAVDLARVPAVTARLIRAELAARRMES